MLDSVKGGPACAKALLCGYRLLNAALNVVRLAKLAMKMALRSEIDPGQLYECIKVIDIAEEAALKAEEAMAELTGAVLPPKS